MKHIKVLLLSMLCLWIGVNTLYAQDTGNGVLPGKFSISATDTVCFSQGNLQCLKLSEGNYSWQFASEQFERLDSANNHVGDPGVWFDLFGYGTSFRSFGDYGFKYLPEQVSRNTGEGALNNLLDWAIFLFRLGRCVVNPPKCDITLIPDYATFPICGDEFRDLDWGANKISNGGNKNSIWHSLTSTEWNYLINNRTNATNLRKFITIQTSGYGDVYGLLLLPDGATPTSVTSIDEQGWKNLEAQGAVFLPTAGLRVDSTYYRRTGNQTWEYTGSYKGFYWTGSCSYYSRSWFSYNTVNPDAVHFDEGGSNTNRIQVDHDFPNFFGFSVRLARRINIPVTFKYNNGIDKDTTIYVNYGDPVPTVPTPHAKVDSCNEYPFNNWGSTYNRNGQIFGAVTYTATYKSGKSRSYTVTFYNWDGTVYRTVSNVQCNYVPSNIGTPVKDDCDSTYKFMGWTPELQEAKNCTAYYPIFKGTAKKYRVTWKDWNDDVLDFDSLENNQRIRTTSVVPERIEADSVYTFEGWTPDTTGAVISCGDTVFTAVYSSVPRKYQITWKDYNDTVLRTESVEYNKTPEYGDDPKRTKDCNFTYEFYYWDPTPMPTFTDTAYTAVYLPTDRSYPVTWFDYKGDTLYSDILTCDDELSYSALAPEKPMDDDSVYFFAGWSPSGLYGTTIDGEYDSYDFNPVYTSVPRWYEVVYSYLDENEKVWKNDTVKAEYNSTLELDTVAVDRIYCDSTYTFKGWSPALETITNTSSLEFTAVYESSVNTYDMTWVALDTTITTVQKFDSALVVPEATDSIWLADSIYVFQSWNPTAESLENKVPCQDTTFTAQYKPVSRYYMVYYTYLDEETYEWKTDSAKVEFGKTLDFDTVGQTRVYCDSTYTFEGWSPALETVTDTSNLVYTAVYSSDANTYDVTWLNWNDTVVFKETLEYNDEVNAPLNPTKTASDTLVWLFDGWTPDPALTMPCDDATYKATFHSVSRFYEDTIVLHDTTIVVVVEYDSVPKLDSLTEVVEHCDSTYTFDHWSPQVRKHDTVPMTYVAVYRAEATMHTVTWKNWDGSVRYTEDYEIGKTINKPTPDPIRPTDGNYVYFFTGWSPVPSTMPCEDTTFVPQFDVRARFYYDTIIRHDDTVVVKIEYGQKPNLNGYKDTLVHCDSTYTFDHWEPADTIQDTMAIKFVAVYKDSINSYPVTWYNGDGSVIETTSYKYGATIIPPLVVPTKATEGGNVFFFTSWSPDSVVTMPCEEVEYRPVFDNKSQYYYDTVFLKYDTIYPVSVEYDSTPDLSKWEYPIVDCDYTYNFDHWEPVVGPQPADTISYKAVYTSSLNSYPLIWKNWDGTPYFTETKYYQEHISLPAGTPVRPTDDSNVYFFSGWYPTPVDTMPCGKTEYTAQFRSEPRQYQDTIILADDTIYPVITEFDSVPDFSKYEYTIVHCDSTYEFDHWEPALGAHPADTVTYKAVYDVTPNSYTLTWKNWDGSTYFTETKEYLDEISIPAGTPVHLTDDGNVYFFTGWYPTPDAEMPCGNTVYTAQFDAQPRYYKDTLILVDDTIYPVIVEYDSMPDFSKYEYTTVHCDSTYTFNHWEPALGSHPADTVTYKAVYDVTPNTYTLTWKNWDGSTYFTETKEYLDEISIPAGTPVHLTDDGNVYFFTGWYPAPDATMPCANTVYTAQFDAQPRYYKDTLILVDDTIYPVIVEYDSMPDFSKYEYKTVHCDSTYTFNHWEPALGSHPADTVTYKAVYDVTPNSYTLTWKNWDGTVIDAKALELNAPVVAPADPTRPTDNAKVYFFAGWDSEPVATMPCNDLIYTAQYLVKDRYYTDSLVLKDTTVAVIVDYDSVPDFSGYTQTVVHCDSTYEFLYWTPTVAAQDTMYAEYVAVYRPRVNKHTVTWLNWDSTLIKTDAVNFDSVVNVPMITPTRPATDSEVYFFTGWTPAPVATMPCEDLTYKADFEAKNRYYMDTIVLLDTTVFVPVEYRTIPRLDSLRDTILRCDTLYEWIAWEPSTITIQDTVAVKYTAVYRKTPVTYNLTWKNWDNTTYFAETKYYQESISLPSGTPVRPTDDSNVYFFTGWYPTPDAAMPCGNTSYTAQFDAQPRYYQDTLILVDDSIYPVVVEYDSVPNFSEYEYTIVHCDSTYTFDHWEPALGSHPADTMTYKAVYTAALNSFTLTWKNWDGTVIYSEVVDYNDYVNAPMVVPTRPADGSTVYFFTGWLDMNGDEPVVKMPCQNLVYWAQYDNKNQYYYDTIFLKYDTIYPVVVEYDSTPDLSRWEYPVVDCDYTYNFDHWEPAVGPQPADTISYRAVYTSTLNNYSLTWKNWDGSTYFAETKNYQDVISLPSGTPVRPADASNVYFFTGWYPAPDATMPCNNASYTAQFDAQPRYYQDTVILADDTIYPVITEFDSVPDFSMYEYTIVHCDSTYTFDHWEPALGTHPADTVTYKAVYNVSQNTYTLTWNNWDGTTYYSENKYYHEHISLPSGTPVRPTDNTNAYFFIGWYPTPVDTMPCGNTVYTAMFDAQPRYYQDTIVLLDDTIYPVITEFDSVPDLSMYEYPIVHCDSTYTFNHWEPALGSHPADTVTYRAVYTVTANTYTLTWNNWDGSTYYSETKQYNDIIVSPSGTPVRSTDASNVYFFTGWYPTPDATMPCGNVTYTAQFDAQPLYYNVTVITGDSSYTEVVQYGDVPDLTSYQYTIDECDYHYVFNRWTPAVVAQGTSPMTYTAVYDAFLNAYNVTWKNDVDTVTTTLVYYGDIINAPIIGQNPTRPATQDSLYFFSGWNLVPGTTMGCADMVFYAQFTAKSAHIVDTIVLKDTIIIDTVSYDSLPQLENYQDTVVHCDSTYIFSHWSPAVSFQTENPITYRAIYTAVQNDYYITWVNDGAVVKVDTLHCNDMPFIDDPYKSSTCSADYSFTGWSPAIVPVTGDATYTATYSETVRYHSVTYIDYDNDTLRVDYVTCNTTPSYNCVNRTGNDSVNYLFKEWYPTLGPVVCDTVFYAVYDSLVRNISYDNSRTIIECQGDIATLPSGAVITVNKDTIVNDTVALPARKPYASEPCYNGDSLIDWIVYTIDVKYYKDPVNENGYVIACPDTVILGMPLDLTQVTTDIRNSFQSADDEQTPDWNNSKWEIIDENGNWVEYQGERILDGELGDTIFIRYVIPTTCGQIIYDPIANGCDMTLRQSNADNCPDCQEDAAVIAVYDWLLMYEHVAMQTRGYNVTPDKVNWYKIVGDDWDNLNDWTIPYAIDDEYLGTGYYYTINRAFDGTGDYYSVIDVSEAGDKTLPCRGLMRSRRFHYQAESANAPKAELYPSEVRNSDVIYVIGLQSDVRNEVYVYDMTGKIVSHATVTEDHYEFRATGAAGTYRVVIISENNKQTLSFIIL